MLSKPQLVIFPPTSVEARNYEPNNTETAMAKPTLDGMPVELQITILQQLADLESVRCLITASPRFHQVYLVVRSEILFNHLCRQYGVEVDIAESLAAIRSKNLLAAEPTNMERIVAILDCRRRSREGITKNYDSLDVEEIIELFELHRVATFFLEDYSASLPRPPWWPDDVMGKWGTTVLPLCFSTNERARFFRAFYRLQTWCNIFGGPEYHTGPIYSGGPRGNGNNWSFLWPSQTLSNEDAWLLFFGTMPPWEVEEIGCLWQYLSRKYTQVFEEITNVLMQRYKIEWPDRPNQRPFAIDLLPNRTLIEEIYDLREGSAVEREYRESMIDIGPRFLYKILHLAYEDRQNAVAINVRFSNDRIWDVVARAFFNPLLSPAEQYEYCDTITDLLSFPVLEQPNLGWIRYWLGNDLGAPFMWEWINSPWREVEDWEWGYVLWDAERLIQWKPPILEVENSEQ